MTPPARPSAPTVSRFTGFVLGFVVFICLGMIGLSGYLKYQLDRAESVVAAPDGAVISDQENLDRLRRSLGYSGFIGLAQTYISTHDASLLPDMRAQVKNAEDMISRMPDRVPTEIRRDMQAITATFDAAMQKAEKSASDSSAFTSNDMTALYAALPIMDARVSSAAATARLVAENEVQFWGMLLTLISWGSLIIASALAAGIYLSLRDRNSAPLRALAQSVKNMAHGDMRSAIWGMERGDMVGELARTVDLARYHFSQLPDMSLLSDQGPVRLRFEGNTKSLFEAMMQLITKNSEQVRHHAASLSETVIKQQQGIQHLSKQVETVLQNILTRGQTGDHQIKQVLHEMLRSAQSLKHAQEHAADQLSRIVPFLQERAEGLTEITQLTGKQVSQILNSLMVSERQLKGSAEQSEAAIRKFASTADGLGERLFGAVNLLQASGKVLAETTEATQSRLNEAIEKVLNQANEAVTSHAPIVDETATWRLESLIQSLQGAQQKLEQVLQEQTQTAKAQIDLLTTHSNSLLSQSTTTAQTLSFAADHLRMEQTKFDQTIDHITVKLDQIGSRIEQKASDALSQIVIPTPPPAPEPRDDFDRFATLAAKIGVMTDKLASLETLVQQSTKDLNAAQEVLDQSSITKLLIEIRTGFETTFRNLSQMRDQLQNMVIDVQTHRPIGAPPDDSHWREIAEQIDTTRSNLTQLITQQIDRIEGRIMSANTIETAQPILARDTQEQMEQQTQILTELVTTLSVLDAHMQQLKSDMHSARG